MANLVSRIDSDSVKKFLKHVRAYWSTDKESMIMDAGRGISSSVTPPDTADMYGGYAGMITSSGEMNLEIALRLDRSLMQRYRDYEEMDDYGESSAVLDLFADDTTVPDMVRNKTIWAVSEDLVIKNILDDLLHRRLRIEEDIWGMARTLSKYGNCLPAGTRVWTEHGQRAIESVNSGDKVLGYKDGNPELFTVVNRFDNGEKEIFRVRTRHREFFATADHPVLVDRGDGVEWVKVRDLKVSRFDSGGINEKYNPKLVIATSVPEGDAGLTWDDLYIKKVTPTKRSVGGNVINSFVLPDVVEPWVCRLLGFWWGDGCVATERMDSRNSTVCYSRGVYEDQNDYYDSLLRKMSLIPYVSKDKTITQVNSIKFKCFMLSLGWKNGASKKRLPGWLGRLTRDCRRAFLDGFLDADGWTSEPPTWSSKAYHFEIANVELARDFKNLIDGLGYRSGNLRLRHRDIKEIAGNAVKSTQISAMLTFSFHEYDPGFMSENLLSVEPAGSAHVYDLEVDDDAHNFVAEGVVVHNCFAEIIVTKIGVVGLNFLSPPTMRRIHDKKGGLLGFIQDVRGNFNIEKSEIENQLKRPKAERDKVSGCVIFEPWEIVHWRLQSKQIRAPYGWGVLDSARWIWRRLMMFEDSALVNKLTRSAARYAFYINVGDLDERRARAHVRKIQRGYQKKKLIDPATGNLDFSYNPLSPPEDFWIPTKDGKDSTRIETISGLDSQSMEDVEYFRNKFYAAMKVSPSFFSGEANMDRTSSQQDVRFARTAMRIQRELRNGLRQVNRIHLAALNIDPDLSDYDTEMAQPSYIFELAQVEVRNAQVALAEGYRELMPRDWITRHVLGFSKDDSEEMVKKVSDEKHDDTVKSAATQAQIVRDYPELAEAMVGGIGVGEEMVSEDVTVNKVVKGDIKRLRELLESAINMSKDVSKNIKRVEPVIKKTYRCGVENKANSLSNKRRAG